MHEVSKREVDFVKALEMRANTAKTLNRYLKKAHTGLHFVRQHQRLHVMSIGEMNKNNITHNRIGAASQKVAMGLYYVLKWKESGQKEVNFIFVYKEGGGFYLKLPKEYLDNPEGYIELLCMMQYHAIIVEGNNKKFSNPISFNTIADFWPREQATSEGNKNRLQFHIPISKVTCRHPEEKLGLLFTTSVIDELRILMR